MRATGSEAYVASLGALPPAASEDELFKALGVPFLPPELREAAFDGTPPALVEPSAIRGDVHVHTTWSDGKASVLEMAEAARALGYDYIAICDHTKNVRVVPGLDADDLRRQAEEIAEANERLAPFRILRGSECDILADGTLDLPDDILDELEWVQASVHAGQRQSREQLTKRTLAAVEHPAVKSISHPQGRILNHRPPNAVDLEAVFAACAANGTAIETNGLPRPDRSQLGARARGDPRRRAHHVLDGRALGARALEHAALGRNRTTRLGDGGRRAQHARARRAAGAEVTLYAASGSSGPECTPSCTFVQCVRSSAAATTGSVCPGL